MLVPVLLLAFAAPPVPPAARLDTCCTPQPLAAAQPGELTSIRSAVEAFFQAISAPAGGKLPRARLRALFTPCGRIALPVAASATRPASVVFLSPDQYADSSDQATASSGFFDHVIALHAEQFGAIGQAFASYESTEDAAGKKRIARGVKSFELLHLNGRWYLTQVSWDRESSQDPIPEELLQDRVR